MFIVVVLMVLLVVLSSRHQAAREGQLRYLSRAHACACSCSCMDPSAFSDTGDDGAFGGCDVHSDEYYQYGSWTYSVHRSLHRTVKSNSIADEKWKSLCPKSVTSRKWSEMVCNHICEMIFVSLGK